MSSVVKTRDRPVLSPSQLSTWLACPLRWHALYVLQMPRRVTPSMAIGSAVHAALERHHKSMWLDLPVEHDELDVAMRTEFDRRMEEEGVVVTEAERHKLLDRGGNLLQLYRERFMDDRVAASELHLQAPLVDPETGEDLGADLQGFVDLVADDRIVDVKVQGAGRSAFSVGINAHLQLACYAYLLERSAPEVPVHGAQIRSLIRTSSPSIVVHDIPLVRDHGHLFEVARAHLRARDREQAPRPTFTCAPSCDASAACAAWHGLEVAS